MGLRKKDRTWGAFTDVGAGESGRSGKSGSSLKKWYPPARERALGSVR